MVSVTLSLWNISRYYFPEGDGRGGIRHHFAGNCWDILHEVDGIHVNFNRGFQVFCFSHNFPGQLLKDSDIFPNQNHVPAILAFDPGNGSFGGTHDSHLICSVPVVNKLSSNGFQFSCAVFRRFFFQTRYSEIYHPWEWGIAEVPALCDFIGIESLTVMTACPLDCIMSRIECLNNNLSRSVAPATSAGHLCDQLKGFFGCSEIRDTFKCEVWA